LLIDFINSHRGCGAHLLKQNREMVKTGLGISKRALSQQSYQPIRIHLDYSFIESRRNKFSYSDIVDLQRKIMPKAVDVLQNLFQVKQLPGPMKVNSTRCDNYIIPDKYTMNGEGIDTDLIIFVMIDDTGFFIKNQVEAGAVHCLQHYYTKRPVVGYIQFKPDLHVDNSTALDYMVWLTIHEITHVLGFNDGLYQDWVDENFNSLGPNNIIGRGFTHGKPYSYLKTSKVLEKAREHFNCPSLNGVPLEYNGGEGTAGAHWSKKYMNTDYMIGDSYGENLISEITLAMFEDSGWYKVNYEYANIFLWGKNKGCEFFESNCIEKDLTSSFKTRFLDEFCTNLNEPVCSTSYIFRASCATQYYHKLLPEQNRYFDDPKFGGIDPLTDYCPIAIEEKNNQLYYGGSCRVGENSNINKYEKICPECACFMSSLSIKSEKNRLSQAKSVKEPNLDNNMPRFRAACHEFICESNNSLYVKIGEKKVLCNPNSETRVQGYEGVIYCPPVEVVCHQRYKCKYGCTEKYENSKGFFNYRLKFRNIIR